MQKKHVFFRNDDVRDSLDDSLLKITELFIKNNIPISHAVEPYNVSSEVANWLFKLKTKHPDLIEIIQHGYHHNLNNKYKFGMEFGYNRTLEDQFSDISKGVKIMNDLFPNLWDKIMTFPYGSYNKATLEVLDQLNFKAVSTSIDFSTKHRLKDFIGRTLKQHVLFGKKISYHNQRRIPFKYKDFAVSINLIKKYLGYDKALHYSLDELISQTYFNVKYTNFAGVLLHHRFHKEDYIFTIENYIKYLKDNNFTFVKFSDIM